MQLINGKGKMELCGDRLGKVSITNEQGLGLESEVRGGRVHKLRAVI